MSGIVGAQLPFFAQESHLLAQEYVNGDDVIAFPFCLINEKRWILIEIRSRATLGGLAV